MTINPSRRESERYLPRNLFLLLNTSNVVLSVIQQVGLPLFLASLGRKADIYFAILWYNVLLNVITWPIVFFKYYTKTITPKMKAYTKKHHFKFVLLGLLEAIYEILNWYAASLYRTSGSLQAILTSSVLPFTFIFSHIIIRKKYTTERLMGNIIAFLGIIVSLIPSIHNFTYDSAHFLWPVVFLASDVFLVLANITQESIFKDNKKFDNILILAWQGFYTLLTVIIFFWVDIIPWFGTSDSLAIQIEKLWYGFVCFFTPWNTEADECSYCMINGLVYVISIVMYSYVQSELIKRAKLQTVALISAVTPSLAVLFWLIFPGLNAWANGKKYNGLDIMCYLISLPIIAIGVFIAPTYSYNMDDLDIYIYYN
jgi:drug/metabolite transporter (DMT)-like permease